MNIKSILLFSVLSLSFLHGQKSSKDFVNRQDILELLDKFKVPAMGLGIIENGKLISVSAYGEIKAGVTAPYNTIFDVASLTKSVVTMTTLQLIENGDWDLDEPLHTYWVDEDITMDSLHRRITTRHALSHSIGFANWRWMNKSGKLEFLFEPGSSFNYSGEGFEYLRKALENKFHMSLQKLSDSLLFRPLGMKDSRHSWDSYTDEKRFAVGHDTLKTTYALPKGNVPNGADNVLTTIEDFGIFSIHVMEKLQNASEVYHEMIQTQTQVRTDIAMGLGWFLFPNLAEEEYALYNAGGDPGTHTVVVLLPKSKKGIIIFTNGDKGYLLYKALLPRLLDCGKEIINRI